MTKIAGIIIAFNPDFNKLIFNIESFLDHIEQLFIVFNSPVDPGEITRLQSINAKIQLIDNKENIGIATAINRIAQHALDHGYDWLLTMDQDSSFQSGDFFEAFNRSNRINVSIFSPNSISSSEINIGNTFEAEEVLHVVTSGNLLNLEIWKTLGGFEEKLFIDEVDNDYCLKAVSGGYKIINFKNIFLVHELGKNKEVSFLFKKYTIITHPPIRAYYIFRNNLYMFRKYKKKFPEFVISRKKMLLKVFIEILLYSEKRIQNCQYIAAGIKDYLLDSYGPYKGKLNKNSRNEN